MAESEAEGETSSPSAEITVRRKKVLKEKLAVAANKPAASPANIQSSANTTRQQVVGRPAAMGKEHITYQRHVLFALTTAFLIKLVANGVKLPTIGK